MPDSKITALTSISTSTDPANDPLVIVDVSDTSMAATGTTKKVTLNQLLGASGTATLASATITGNLTLSAGTVNGVGYLNASKVLTAGSALVFDGTNLGVGGTGQLRFATSGGAIGDNSIGTENSFSMMLRCGRGSTSNIELASDKLVFGVAATEQMRLNTTGLGIGTSSPAAALDLTNTGVTASREIRIENSAVRTFLGVEGSSGRFVGSATNNAYFGCTGAFGLEFATNNNVRMVVDTSGQVGIGVAPSAKLHVEGSGPQARFSTASAVDARHEYYRNGIREGLLYWDANLIGLYATQSSGELVLASSNTIRVRVKSSGQVRFVPLASDPAGAEAGDVYYNSTSNKLKCYNGTTWNDLF